MLSVGGDLFLRMGSAALAERWNEERWVLVSCPHPFCHYRGMESSINFFNLFSGYFASSMSLRILLTSVCISCLAFYASRLATRISFSNAASRSPTTFALSFTPSPRMFLQVHRLFCGANQPFHYGRIIEIRMLSVGAIR